VHGDVIHSRAYVIDQSNVSLGITAYYGANDGALRAIDTSSGKELWAFFAPESFSKLSRLRTDTPLVAYSGFGSSGATPKDYFFDGSIGAYQSSDNRTAWIYASQRRGGRMIYAFDVSTPGSPSFKWRIGCPDLGDDTNCTTGTSGIGQTWSPPSVAFIQGYGDYTKPVVVLGGGYDGCEDANSSSPTCSSEKGRIVYVLDGSTGTILASFPTDRSVVADVALVDVNGDGYVDYAYAADTGGNIYRIDFVSDPYSATAMAPGSWTLRKVAYTTGAGRKFMNAPALLPSVSKTGNYAKVFVALGSGDREKPLITQYPYTTPVQNRFYVYVDDLTLKTSSTPAPTPVNLDAASTMKDFTTTTSCSDASVLPAGSNAGWYMDLRGGVDPPGSALPGEQTTSAALIAGGMITFSTNRPFATPPNSCSANLGEARGYWLNLLNGSGAIGVSGTCGGARSGTFVGGGLPPSPVLATVPVNGKAVSVVIGAVERSGAPSAVIQAQKITAPVSLTRRPVYWYKSGDN
jgi:Tfp pilus tip-associated adhesin PilY1